MPAHAERAAQIVDTLLRDLDDRSGFDRSDVPPDLRELWREQWITLAMGIAPITSKPTCETYETGTDSTAIGGYPDAGSGSIAAVNYAILGLNDETGEVAGAWKKFLRGDRRKNDLPRGSSVNYNSPVRDVMHPDDVDNLIAEIGDALWYLTRVARELKVPLWEVMARNAAKLKGRLARGTIKGSGDKR